jgi:hypothetical protein
MGKSIMQEELRKVEAENAVLKEQADRIKEWFLRHDDSIEIHNGGVFLFGVDWDEKTTT